MFQSVKLVCGGNCGLYRLHILNFSKRWTFIICTISNIYQSGPHNTYHTAGCIFCTDVQIPGQNWFDLFLWAELVGEMTRFPWNSIHLCAFPNNFVAIASSGISIKLMCGRHCGLYPLQKFPISGLACGSEQQQIYLVFTNGEICFLHLVLCKQHLLFISLAKLD